MASEKDLKAPKEHQALRGYKVELPKKKNPLVILYDVDSTTEKGELAQSLTKNFMGN